MAEDPRVHPSAIVEEGATLGAGVVVGPFCRVGAQVTLGEGVELRSHVVVEGITEIGAGTRVWPFAALGSQPQDLKFAGEETRLIVGARNLIREGATMNTGTARGGGVTRVGDGGLFMVNSHVGHDCAIGDGVILANSVAVAGHVVVQDRAILGGNAAVHQNVRIGTGAIVGGLTGVERDVPPYCSAVGDRARLVGLNLVGLRRAGVPRDGIQALREAYAAIFEADDGALVERARRVAEAWPDQPLVQTFAGFVLEGGSRSFVTPRGG